MAENTRDIGQVCDRQPSKCSWDPNISSTERVVSVLTGSVLAGCGVARKGYIGWSSAIAGGALIWRGLTGRCQVYDALGMNTAEHSGQASLGSGEGIRLETRVTVQRSPDEVFAFWRKLSNLPTVFHHLKSVTERNFKHSRWVANGPLGLQLEWDAEIMEVRPGEIISWRSLEGGNIATSGSVRFERLNSGDTVVHVLLRYSPPAGKLGRMLAEWLGQSPDKQLEADLQNFKQRLESQEMTERIAAPREFSRTSSGDQDSGASRAQHIHAEQNRWHIGDRVVSVTGAQRGKVIGIEPASSVTLGKAAATRYSVMWDNVQKGEGDLRYDDLRPETVVHERA